MELAQRQRNFVSQVIHDYESDLTRVMPRHSNAEAFFGLALAYVRRDPKLLYAASVNAGSLVLALRECAALGHMPIRGKFALVPFKDNTGKVPGGWSIVGMEEWRGVVERMQRSGGVRGGPYVEVVRSEDSFVWYGPNRLPDHRFDVMDDPEKRGPLSMVYAWAELAQGGLSQVVRLNKYEIAKIRKDTPFWRDWEEAMWRKSALHRLEGFVTATSETLFQQAAAEAAAARVHGVPDVPTRLGDPHREDTSIDGEFVDSGASGGAADEPWPDVATPPDADRS